MLDAWEGAWLKLPFFAFQNAATSPVVRVLDLKTPRFRNRSPASARLQVHLGVFPVRH
jgi:hypothetical protein